MKARTEKKALFVVADEELRAVSGGVTRTPELVIKATIAKSPTSFVVVSDVVNFIPSAAAKVRGAAAV